ncbi:MalY/PatB family protein [Pseudoclavibacter helvolus]|uniref:MalY/PatB family protein n=1 Tax=Pseudoclavibacter helvolus TaxID=255205 RepID=UPI000837E45B|nr:aminotransferase class I/II-fold pyridoxal phosphate-dependent enzyme [Pseudoclavibacter helvolus]
MTSFEEVDARSLAELREAGVGSSKWDTFPDAIGSFIAESDYGTAPAVRRVVAEQLERQSFGYVTKAAKAELGAALSEWMHDRYAWQVDLEWIGVLPEVLTSLELTIEHYTRPGSAVILPTPTYMPFFTLPVDHGREIVETPLLQDAGGSWGFDYEAINRAFARGAGLLVLSNPSNPTGTVFTREQLLSLVDIVDRHGGRVWSDEIHAPLVFGGLAHVPYASLSDVAANHTVTATSASKGWNIAGLKASQIVFSNTRDLETWHRIQRWPSHTAGTLGILASTAAYREGRDWLDALVTHLDGNRRLLSGLVDEHLPGVDYVEPDASYLAWLDFRGILADAPVAVRGSASRRAADAPPTRLGRRARTQAGVAATDGLLCGAHFDGWLRINFATARPILAETVRRLESLV